MGGATIAIICHIEYLTMSVVWMKGKTVGPRSAMIVESSSEGSLYAVLLFSSSGIPHSIYAASELSAGVSLQVPPQPVEG